MKPFPWLCGHSNLEQNDKGNKIVSKKNPYATKKSPHVDISVQGALSKKLSKT